MIALGLGLGLTRRPLPPSAQPIQVIAAMTVIAPDSVIRGG